MTGPCEWVWKPDFGFEVTHIGGNTRVAMEVGFGLRPKGSQLMFMVKTTAPKEWVALSGDEVRLLDDILEFFETHKIYFGLPHRLRRRTKGFVLCSEKDYDPFVDALKGYASLRLADEAEAERLLDKAAVSMTRRANVLLKIITTFVDQADIISKADENDPSPYWKQDAPDEAQIAMQDDQVHQAEADVIRMRRELVMDLDSME